MPAWTWDLWFVVDLESWFVHVNFMTLLTSSHFILSIQGVSKCVLHAPGSLIKCRGSLVVRPPGMPECLQNLRDFLLPEADFVQAPQQKHPSKSRWSSEFARLHFQDSPELQIFRFQNSRRHPCFHVTHVSSSYSYNKRSACWPRHAMRSSTIYLCSKNSWCLDQARTVFLVVKIVPMRLAVCV